MLIRALTDQDLAERNAIARNVQACRDRGECPSCVDLSVGGVYPDRTERTFYEDDSFVCMLEQFPRNVGHTIVLPKDHWEDISELPVSQLRNVYGLIHGCVKVLKSVFEAEKVYLCTMCDGSRNHLHYQLIPRLPGDSIAGSKLLVAERKALIQCSDVTSTLRSASTTLNN